MVATVGVSTGVGVPAAVGVGAVVGVDGTVVGLGAVVGTLATDGTVPQAASKQAVTNRAKQRYMFWLLSDERTTMIDDCGGSQIDTMRKYPSFDGPGVVFWGATEKGS
jgi:hypothetical protein